MKKVLKTVFLIIVTLGLTTSCVNDDDFVIPTVYDYLFNQSFSDIPVGSGSNEVAIALDGWVNVNLQNTGKLWHGRSFNSNNHAEFSSYYSNTGTNDKAWLITPKLNLTNSSGEILSFTTKYRYSNGDVLKVYISTDFDGSEANISTANWIELEITLPTTDDEVTNSGAIDLSSYESDNVRIAFVYTGSKAGITTTCQLDNIKISKN
ncbi:DUF5017 domain-containing protein [Flavobacterium jejuense]|uniref:DUF5017 domain-containing protein n=1 Tax=Flavobacterium jejuense TaxID=1544455 RepID=A0ABX0IQZ5_9FLAO|nr:choice-of-anchor J domain-containing protein [Flavobacterium jejuense]NHN25495.1 DUF5017 domain-containing protein [Flavobacterium jejuense]